ncbi:MAG: hypothetical protein AABY22_28475, partial [Nanoarchaeota archaeon]
MGFWNKFLKKEEKYSYIISAGAPLKEQFKGIIYEDTFKINKDIGEEHPFDFRLAQGLYKGFPLIFGAIDKIVDFAVGPGFYIKSKDPRAEKIINDFILEVEFDSILRGWMKEALNCGNSFMEIGGGKNKVPEGLKILPVNEMFVKRDKFGEVLEYSQVKNKITKNVPFNSFEIAHLKYNVVGSEAYGMGIVYPCLDVTNKLLKAQHDMQMLLERKANNPFFLLVESDVKGIMPSQRDLDDLRDRITSLKNNQEWVLGPNINPMMLDFGNISDKFQTPFKHYEDLIFFALQVPEVLMGRGSIPEGLATVQMEAFQRRIQSIQAETEKVIEQKIFKRVLDANGLVNVHVEFEWGQPSNEDTRKEIEKIT